ncbi:hypothetical protein WJX74_002560 [Apatococcus lobatus]|uniref:Uncharacterized protein n=1 Tax=Apatococcus lobatus TaxID=904363 RepID=A0AAW1RVC1_9CHLO
MIFRSLRVWLVRSFIVTSIAVFCILRYAEWFLSNFTLCKGLLLAIVCLCICLWTGAGKSLKEFVAPRVSFLLSLGRGMLPVDLRSSLSDVNQAFQLLENFTTNGSSSHTAAHTHFPGQLSRLQAGLVESRDHFCSTAELAYNVSIKGIQFVTRANTIQQLSSAEGFRAEQAEENVRELADIAQSIADECRKVYKQLKLTSSFLASKHLVASQLIGNVAAKLEEVSDTFTKDDAAVVATLGLGLVYCAVYASGLVAVPMPAIVAAAARRVVGPKVVATLGYTLGTTFLGMGADEYRNSPSFAAISNLQGQLKHLQVSTVNLEASLRRALSAVKELEKFWIEQHVSIMALRTKIRLHRSRTRFTITWPQDDLHRSETAFSDFAVAFLEFSS